MIDSKIIKENPDVIRDMLMKRNIEFQIDTLFEADKRRRILIIELQNLKQQKNTLAKEIAFKKKSNEDVSNNVAKMEYIGSQIKKFETEFKDIEQIYLTFLKSIPNFPHESVPIGKDENDNIIISNFNPSNPSISDMKLHMSEEKESTEDEGVSKKSHIEIAYAHDLVDLERAGKISGARFYFLKNELVKLGLALSNFALDYLSKEGYTIIQPPFLIRKEAMEGAVILSDFEETIYKIENEDLYLIGTSEHPMASMHMDEILEGKNLPIRYAAISPCFRKEAGAHGKDMKGLFRVHQFDKIEQFIFCDPEQSWKEHERLLRITEKFYQMLEIPYRTIVLCSGDLGKVSAKTYDIEAWFPAQKAFREICSCSNCTDYQARGLKIRYRNNPNEDTKLVHTLNSTLVAVQRTLVAILENYQTEHGTIRIPKALQSYMGNLEEIV
jgi:seryl-tRNA synthetase